MNDKVIQIGGKSYKQFLKNQEEFGKKIIEFCKEYEGSAFYNIAMKSIEFGYQLAQEENTIKPVQEKTSWNRDELIIVLNKFGNKVYGEYTRNEIMPDFVHKWIEENL